jgi:hypothetical protein
MVGGAGVWHLVGHEWGGGGVGAVELRQPMRDWGSHSLNHDVEDDDCCSGGRVNEGPCCTGKPYWGAAKKACDVD